LERFFDRVLDLYDISLQWSLRHRLTVMVFSAAILVVTAWQFVAIPKGFLPAEDNSQIFAFTEAVQGISFEAMKQHQMEIDKIAREDPNRLDFFSALGCSPSNSGILFMHLKEPKDRPKVPS